MYDERQQKLVDALAEYFDCTPDHIGGHIIGVEVQSENGQIAFHTIFAGMIWNVKGYIAEITDQVKQEFARRSMAAMMQPASDE